MSSEHPEAGDLPSALPRADESAIDALNRKRRKIRQEIIARARSGEGVEVTEPDFVRCLRSYFHIKTDAAIVTVILTGRTPDEILLRVRGEAFDHRRRLLPGDRSYWMALETIFGEDVFFPAWKFHEGEDV